MRTNELNIIMVAPRMIGKTSLLAAMHEEFDKTFEQANLQTWTDDTRTHIPQIGVKFSTNSKK
ncbi:hypothetical protein [Planktothrix agardhii]|uniref:Uncharacterized protein n=1 Tax=Planktothrix agardhii TaxID=1160 RepID=A0AAD1Q0K2_PLAAG|nr:hypothetical protein [Planktothrix agardhii]CAD5945887.1 hypothetical protein PANO66_02287 [Planktothrix agardhii]